MVEHQGESSNCGWFSIRFLIDRYTGKSFAESTGFTKLKDKLGEAKIERFKRAYPFSYV